MKLSSENVNEVFRDCLFRDDEDTSNHLKVESVQMQIGFNPERLKENEDNIISMLECLPETFKKTGGGGMTFLNMCEDREGNQWASLHRTMDELVALGIGVEKISFCLPRDMWSVLPGGMPYVRVNI